MTVQAPRPPQSSTGVTRILVVDDHPIFQQGIAAILAPEEDLNLVGCASAEGEALDLLDEVDPDVVIVDLTLESGHGLHCT